MEIAALATRRIGKHGLYIAKIPLAHLNLHKTHFCEH